MSDKFFFQNLPELQNYREVANSANYHKAPDDWYVILTDISGSTQAIEKGKYREVNIIGASVIVALTNMCKPLEIPFIFGGDGATILIPAEFAVDAADVLDSTRRMANESFGFQLRCAIIPVSEIHKHNKYILVSRYRVSNQYCNAVFSGGGIKFAEQLLKDRSFETKYLVKIGKENNFSADYSGLTCRWDNISPDEGKIVALLVKVRDDHNDNDSAIYEEVIDALNNLSPDIKNPKPFDRKNLYNSFSWRKLDLENKIHSFGNNALALLYKLKIYFQTVVNIIFMKLNIKIDMYKWSKIEPESVSLTDSKKFDEMIRMVINLDDNQITEMKNLLERLRGEGKIVYGYNISENAILTCVVERRNENNFYLVDGAEGGYALAAKMLKGML